ncbi:MAG: glycosyltransferase [Hyphomicrobiaceae bacterium]
MKVVVVTPYYRESDELLLQCINSVFDQTKECVHYLVSDGYPSGLIEERARKAPNRVRHIKLDRSHNDFGNTPRSIGAMLGQVEQNPDSICFLDADNWFDPIHIKECENAARSRPGADYVIAKRRLVRPDGTPLPPLKNIVEDFTDTSCFFLLRGAFYTIRQWLTQPHPLKRYCDIVYGNYLRSEGLSFASVKKTTVNYRTMWRAHYDDVGETPPAAAKPGFDDSDLVSWWNKLTPKDKQIVERDLGYRPEI